MTDREHALQPFLAIGPYRVVVSKQVGEEAISVEFYRKHRDDAVADLGVFMQAFQTHREQHNARVLQANEQQLALILQKTRNAEDELNRVGGALAAAKAELAEVEANGGDPGRAA